MENSIADKAIKKEGDKIKSSGFGILFKNNKGD